MAVPLAGPGTWAAIVGIGTCCARALAASTMRATPIVPIVRLYREFFIGHSLFVLQID
jgi:hypothetical protein